jgi:hypothetical protein
VCGTWNDLEVDHRDRTSKVSHRVWTWNRDRAALELEGCQVLCRVHHIEKGVLAGDLMGSARLTVDDVAALRLMRDRMTVNSLADFFAVSTATIRAALSRRTWRHVDEFAGDVAQRAADIGLIGAPTTV